MDGHGGASEGRGVGPEDRRDEGPEGRLEGAPEGRPEGAPEGGPEDGQEPRSDTPAARRRWLLGLAVILLAMIFVPGVVYRLTAPRPVGVTVAPAGPEAPQALAALVQELGPALDRHPTLVFVRWDPDSAAPPAQALLLVELRSAPPPAPAAEDPPGAARGGDPEGPSPAGPVIRLVRRADGTVVWQGRATAGEGESAAEAVARAVAAAVQGPSTRQIP